MRWVGAGNFKVASTMMYEKPIFDMQHEKLDHAESDTNSPIMMVASTV